MFRKAIGNSDMDNMIDRLAQSRDEKNKKNLKKA